MNAIHLIDDRRMGGVTRFLEQLNTLRPGDKTEFCKRGSMRAVSYGVDLIVSHLAISWRTLPMLIALRACNPKARLIHIEHSYCAGFEKHRVSKQRRFRALLRAAYGDPQFDEVKRFGFVGRLDEQKGLDIVVRAWCASPPKDAVLEIYGDGPMREELEKIAEHSPSVRFHGRTDHPADAYQNIDVALMPSRWEPYGLSCLEARAAGRPVLIANVDGLPEQMRSGGGLAVGNDEAGWQTVLHDRRIAASLQLAAGVGRRSARLDKCRAVSFWTALGDEKARASQAAFVAVGS